MSEHTEHLMGLSCTPAGTVVVRRLFDVRYGHQTITKATAAEQLTLLARS